MIAYLSAIVTVIFLATCAQAQAGMQEGIEAKKNGDYLIAEKEFGQLANKGEAAAQYNLGQMYDYGRGVPQNDKLSI